uniref:Gasdermin pore forming domain-containing protein n=1 Tax=Denticeps clupeoides TaxID=299321 RepID=A0AAY4BGV7_9TELE
MLGKATGHLVRQIDPDGSLIGVSRLADSDRLQPAGCVTKDRYTQTHNSILPLCCMKVFVFKMGGALHAEMGGARMQAEGRGSSQLQSSFGKLRKEVVNVRMLLDSSEDRRQVLSWVLFLAVLKQRIITSSPCSIMFSGLQRGTCSAVLRALGSRSIQVQNVSVSESTSVQLDSDVSMEIPPNTVLAYSVIDLLIKENGNYEFCLQPEVQGGFASGRTSRRSWLPPHLQSAEFLLRAEQLLDSAGVALKREMGGVWAESQDTPGPAPSAAVCCCPWVELPEQHGDIPCAIVTTQGSRTTQQMMMMDDGDDANVPEVQQMLAELFHVENFAF